MILFACEQQYSYNKDFSLVYTGETEKIDLRNNTLTRTYVGGYRQAEFEISVQDKIALFKLVASKRVWLIEAKHLKRQCEEVSLPEFSIELEVNMNSTEKLRFHWTTNNCSESVDDLWEITSYLREVVEKDKAVKALEPTDMIFE
jgi:hypothetical protein